MGRITKFKKNDMFHTTLINVIYQFKCDKSELMALTILSRLLAKTNKKYNDEGKFVKERLNRYIINYSVLNQAINDVYFLNFSLLIPSNNVIKDHDLKSSITFLLDTIYDNNLKDNKLFEKEKRLYTESLLNNYKNIDFIAEKNMLDLLDQNCIFNKLKYKDLDNINKLTLEDVNNFYNKYIKTIEPKVFVNGNVDIDELENLIDNYFKDMQLKKYRLIKNYNNFYTNFNLIKKEDTSKFYQSIVHLVYGFKDYNKEDFYKLLLIELLLSSSSSDLLLQNLRKKNNLVYTSSASIMMKNGLLFIKAMTNKDNISIVKMIINELLNDLKNTKKYKKYIDTIINNYELNMNRELDNFYITSNYVINKYYETDLTSQEELVKLKNISLDELKEFINRMVLVCDYTLEGEL